MSDRRTRDRATDDGTYPDVAEELEKIDERTAASELAKFTEKFNANTKYSGFRLQTTIHMPCGFCAEPDFLVAKILDVDVEMKKANICKNCGRGLKTIFKVDKPGEKVFEMVQFCGPNGPKFLPPIRRIDCAICNDTHKMTIKNLSGDELSVMCTKCPRPCPKCVMLPHGAFCRSTPCPCSCHREKRAGGS